MIVESNQPLLPRKVARECAQREIEPISHAGCTRAQREEQAHARGARERSWLFAMGMVGMAGFLISNAAFAGGSVALPSHIRYLGASLGMYVFALIAGQRINARESWRSVAQHGLHPAGAESATHADPLYRSTSRTH